MKPYSSVDAADSTSCILTNSEGFDVAFLEHVTVRAPGLPAEHHLTPVQWQDMINLVDAAPDLLEALQELLAATVDQDEAYGIELTESELEARGMARAAIGKATGVQPPMPLAVEALYEQLGDIEQAEIFAIEAGMFDRLPGLRAKQVPLKRAINAAEGREIYPTTTP